MPESSYKRLLIDMQNGNRKAMESFFRRLSPYVFAVCLRYVADSETAKDLVHDAFLKIFTSVGSFKLDAAKSEAEVERSLKAWTARIAVNLSLNHLRDTAALQFVAAQDAMLDEVPDEEADPAPISAETLRRLIEDLPPNYRAVFNLFAIEGYSHREIAKMLGISEAVSATQYHRAKAALKRKIKELL